MYKYSVPHFFNFIITAIRIFVLTSNVGFVVKSKALLLLKFSIGILCLVAFVVYKYRRRHLSLDDSIENFLQSHNNLMPIRYSFSDIKKMTKLMFQGQIRPWEIRVCVQSQASKWPSCSNKIVKQVIKNQRSRFYQ